MARQDKRASTLADHSVSTRPLLATTNKGILVKDALMKMHPCVGLASSPDHRRQAALCQNPHLRQSLEISRFLDLQFVALSERFEFFVLFLDDLLVRLVAIEHLIERMRSRGEYGGHELGHDVTVASHALAASGARE